MAAFLSDVSASRSCGMAIGLSAVLTIPNAAQKVSDLTHLPEFVIRALTTGALYKLAGNSPFGTYFKATAVAGTILREAKWIIDYYSDPDHPRTFSNSVEFPARA